MEQWLKHYLEFYSRENSITKEVLDDIDDLPFLEGSEIIKCCMPVLIKPISSPESLLERRQDSSEHAQYQDNYPV